MQQEETRQKSDTNDPLAQSGTITREIRHTRRCDGRLPACSCFLKLESAFFRKNLLQKSTKKHHLTLNEAPSGDGNNTGKMKASGVKKAKVKGWRTITNLQQFDVEIKQEIAAFLAPIELVALSMVSKGFYADVEVVAERGIRQFMAIPSRAAHLLKQAKTKHESWSRFMHVQMSCVYKIFVYYTAYKTGEMRSQFKHWTFGVIHVDPNEPYRSILPNAWKFHQHEPWLRKRANGKDGEWLLRDSYKLQRAPKKFHQQVKEWTSTLQPGSFLAVAYQNQGSLEPAWWEAQVWYVWRADGREDPAIVFDPETETHTRLHPRDLAKYFNEHPLHVIDVCSTPGSVCRKCAAHGRTFKYCHVDKGHPML